MEKESILLALISTIIATQQTHGTILMKLLAEQEGKTLDQVKSETLAINEEFLSSTNIEIENILSRN